MGQPFEATLGRRTSANLNFYLMVGRPKKASPQETIEYEINMLRFAHIQINRAAQSDDLRDHRFWMMIECFLLHYRNLIQFLSPSGKWKDDLSLENDFGEQVNEAKRIEIELIIAPLIKKYSKQISKYLAHCTRLRHELDRDWQVNEMYAELLPAIHLFSELKNDKS